MIQSIREQVAAAKIEESPSEEIARMMIYKIVVISETDMTLNCLGSPQSQPCVDIRRNPIFTFSNWVNYRIYPDWCI